MRLKVLGYLSIAFLLVYVVFPALPNGASAYAWSPANVNAQHFTGFTDGNTPPQWTVTTSTGTGGPSIIEQTLAEAPNDNFDTLSNSQFGYVSNSSACGGCTLVVTYTDPLPQAVSGQRYVLIDLNTVTSQQIDMAVSTSTGQSVTATTDNLLSCTSAGTFLSATTGGGTVWDTAFIDTTAYSLTGNLVSVSLIFPNGNNAGINGVFIDNLQGSNTWPANCVGGPPPTPIPTNTPTFTVSPTFTFTSTATSTATPSPTNSPSNTPTNTPTPSPTNTPTNTPINTFTPTNTFTNTDTPTNTNTSVNTPTNTGTSTNTPTNTGTSTFTNTNTFTFTPTITPTFTATGSFTGTFTFTFTNTNTSTPTFTFTPSPTFTPTPTNTVTNTSTKTFTPTITFTPTYTFTSGPSPTTTATLCPVNVYPNPMDFQANPPNNHQCPSSNPCIKFGCIPVSSTVKIYTIALELVRLYSPGDPNFTLSSTLNSGTLTWDGNNGDGNPVSSGFYIYVVDGPAGRTFGKLAISRTRTGP